MVGVLHSPGGAIRAYKDLDLVKLIVGIIAHSEAICALH
jgi:hypothetical protein